MAKRGANMSNYEPDVCGKVLHDTLRVEHKINLERALSNIWFLAKRLKPEWRSRCQTAAIKFTFIIQQSE